MVSVHTCNPLRLLQLHWTMPTTNIYTFKIDPDVKWLQPHVLHGCYCNFDGILFDNTHTHTHTHIYIYNLRQHLQLSFIKHIWTYAWTMLVHEGIC